jgi:hypothetical protein
MIVMTRSIAALTGTEPNSIRGAKSAAHGASERLHNALSGATKQTKSKEGTGALRASPIGQRDHPAIRSHELYNRTKVDVPSEIANIKPERRSSTDAR